MGFDAELLELTTLGMKLYSLSFLLCGFNIFGSAFFTALNNGIVSAVISFLRTLVFQVTAILVLPHLLGMNGIWLSVVAAEIAALLSMHSSWLKTGKSTSINAKDQPLPERWQGLICF